MRSSAQEYSNDKLCKVVRALVKRKSVPSKAFYTYMHKKCWFCENILHMVCLFHNFILVTRRIRLCVAWKLISDYILNMNSYDSWCLTAIRRQLLTGLGFQYSLIFKATHFKTFSTYWNAMTKTFFLCFVLTLTVI